MTSARIRISICFDYIKTVKKIGKRCKLYHLPRCSREREPFNLAVYLFICNVVGIIQIYAKRVHKKRDASQAMKSNCTLSNRHNRLARVFIT